MRKTFDKLVRDRIPEIIRLSHVRLSSVSNGSVVPSVEASTRDSGCSGLSSPDWR
jgi:hypothetical protein